MTTEDGVVNGDSHLKTCVVIGGRGFIGRSLVSRLLRLGSFIVRVADIDRSLRLYPGDESDSLLQDALSSGRASYYSVDVRDKSQIVRATEGSCVVFYMGASNLRSDDYYYCYMVIVQGTSNVISACRETGVGKLIYNSTADVVFNGSQDICDGDESLRYPWQFQSMLTDFKAQAEALIRFANNQDSLLTCALRPSIVFGPGDTEFVTLLRDVAKSGYAKFIVGKGENMSDFTYVENVAHAHICAAEALDSRAEFVAGKEFFITNLKPVRFWDFVTSIIEGLGYPRPSIKLPVERFLFIFSLLKWAQEKMGFSFGSYDAAHDFIMLASHTRTFNCSAAKKHIGYSPIVSLEDGIASTLQWFSRAHENSDDSSVQSRANKLLGCGKVADILLWRDEKRTFTSFLILNLLYFWLFFSGKSFTSSTAQLLFLFSVILYGYGVAPSNILGFQIKKISPWSFEISESAMRELSRKIVFTWNRGVRNVKLLGRGGEWSMFFKVTGWLYLVRVMLSHSLETLSFAGLSVAFTAFFMYEQYEVEVHQLAWILLKCGIGLKRVVLENLPTSMATIS